MVQVKPKRVRKCLGTGIRLASLLLEPLHTYPHPRRFCSLQSLNISSIVGFEQISLLHGSLPIAIDVSHRPCLRVAASEAHPPTMSKLSPALKSLINAAHSRPGPVPAPPRIQAVYQRIQVEATERKLGRPSWLGISTAATMTMNSPESMIALYNSTSASKPASEGVQIAEFMREIGLKCIGFNGVRLLLFPLNFPSCV